MLVIMGSYLKHKRKMMRIGAIFVFMLGLTNPISEILFQGKFDFFYPVSPLPLLFSLGKGGKPKDPSAQIYLITSEKNHLFKFDRKFYRALKGPHRRKVQFLLRLTRTKYILDNKSSNFIYEVFCTKYLNLNYLNSQELLSVKVVDDRKDIMNVSCKE